MIKNCNDRKCFCWNGDDDHLRECISKSPFVKEFRKKLVKKKFENRFK